MNDLIEGNYTQVIIDLMERVKKLESREVRGSEASESYESMGLFEAGEFRAHADILDPHDPGEGFSGVRIIGEGVDINGVRYAIVGVTNDAPMFAISAETGEAFFCSGNAVINADGITVTDTLKWIIKQTATNSTYTREAKIGMAIPEGEGVPALQLSLTSPGASELMSNGDFETGDLTNWTKTTETNGAWSIDSAVKQAGLYSAKWTPGALGWGIKSLLHFDGADGSNTITDATGRTWTAQGNAQLDTAQKVFGTASLLLDDAGDYAETANSADFNVDEGDFELEMRIRPKSVSVNQYICGNEKIAIKIDSGGGITGFADIFSVSSYSGGVISADTWHTISFSRYGYKLYLRVDGETIATGDINGNVSSTTNKFYIGRSYTATYYTGHLDEFIFKKGGVIHAADYTPAEAAYDISAAKGVLTNDRVAVTAGNQYTISGYLRRDTGTTGTIKAEAKWYDDPSSGSLVQTDIIGALSSAGSFVEHSETLEAPTGAQSVAIVLTSDSAESSVANFDTFSVQEVAVNARMQLRDDGLYLNGEPVGEGAPKTGQVLGDAFNWRSSVGGSIVPTQTIANTVPYCMYVHQTVAYIGDTATAYMILKAGTYTLRIRYRRATTGGQADVLLNGAAIKEDMEFYNSSATSVDTLILPNIAVTKTGVQKIQFVVSGKNASATDYFMYIVGVSAEENNAHGEFATTVPIPVKDDVMGVQNAATTNYSTHVQIEAGEDAGVASAARFTALRPDFSSLPSGKTIKAAYLRLCILIDSATSATTIQIYKCLRNYVFEQLTWNVFSTGNNWGTAGAANSTTDYDGSVLLGSLDLSAAEPVGRYIDVPFSAAGVVVLQQMYDEDIDNNGFIIRNSVMLNDLYRYASNRTAGKTPEIVIVF